MLAMRAPISDALRPPRCGTLSVAALLAFGTLAWSAGSRAQEEPLLLDEINITAEAAAAAAMTSETTLGRAALLGEFQGASLPTVLNTIPGVTTETTPGDPAIAVNIRGLQGKGRVVAATDEPGGPSFIRAANYPQTEGDEGCMPRSRATV